jgi:hypothetical protein
MLKFSSALIQQHLQFRAFNSPFISFLAARAYNSQSNKFLLGLSLPHTNCYDGSITQRVNVWYPYSAVSGVLSHIVYAIQLIMLGHCLQVYREQPIEAPAQDFTAILKTNCQDWVLNDSKGPMAEILRLRLLAIHIAGETVRQAQIRWKDDG